MYNGFYRNGSKTDHTSGYALLGAAGEENSTWVSQPIIAIWLFQVTDGGEFKNVLTVVWAQGRWELPGMGIIVEKATTFHVNFWMFK